jgi:GntR family transcriptional regulator
VYTGAREVRSQMTDDALQPLRTDRAPLSHRAQQYLLERIQAGTYAPGEQLPSQSELAAQLGISRPTLREALHNLERDGIIILRHGVGTFVAPGNGRRLESGLERLESILELAGRQGLAMTCQGLEVSAASADETVAKHLDVEPGTPLTCVSRVLAVDDRPVAYMVDAVLASALNPDQIDACFGGSVLDLLRHAGAAGGRDALLGARAVAEIVALDADAFLSQKLKVKAGRALLLMEEVLLDANGVAIDFSRNYFLPDCFRFRVVRH